MQFCQRSHGDQRSSPRPASHPRTVSMALPSCEPIGTDYCWFSASKSSFSARLWYARQIANFDVQWRPPLRQPVSSFPVVMPYIAYGWPKEIDIVDDVEHDEKQTSIERVVGLQYVEQPGNSLSGFGWLVILTASSVQIWSAGKVWLRSLLYVHEKPQHNPRLGIECLLKALFYCMVQSFNAGPALPHKIALEIAHFQRNFGYPGIFYLTAWMCGFRNLRYKHEIVLDCQAKAVLNIQMIDVSWESSVQVPLSVYFFVVMFLSMCNLCIAGKLLLQSILIWFLINGSILSFMFSGGFLLSIMI